MLKAGMRCEVVGQLQLPALLHQMTVCNDRNTKSCGQPTSTLLANGVTSSRRRL
jgi:hypothetical protein